MMVASRARDPRCRARQPTRRPMPTRAAQAASPSAHSGPAERRKGASEDCVVAGRHIRKRESAVASGSRRLCGDERSVRIEAAWPKRDLMTGNVCRTQQESARRFGRSARATRGGRRVRGLRQVQVRLRWPWPWRTRPDDRRARSRTTRPPGAGRAPARRRRYRRPPW